MSSRAAKRKRYSDIKNMLVTDLHKITVDSGDFNNDLMVANDDFVQMFKSMEDRQSQMLSRTLLIAEKYREITSLLKEGNHANTGESSTINVELPPAYSENIQRFVHDSSASLLGHAKMFKEQMEDMDKIFKEHGELWNKNINELKESADKIAEDRAKLGIQLSDYMRNI